MLFMQQLLWTSLTHPQVKTTSKTMLHNRAALAAMLLLLGGAGSAWAQGCDLQANSQLIANYAASAQQLATACTAAQTNCLAGGSFINSACCSTCLSALRTYMETNANLIRNCASTLGVNQVACGPALLRLPLPAWLEPIVFPWPEPLAFQLLAPAV
jgi:hypothetical protein